MSESESVKVGVIGAGAIGTIHACVLNGIPNCRVTAIVDQDSKTLGLASKILPSVGLFPTIREMVDHHELDAVYVCTPVPTHSDAVEEICRRSERVALFVEKPLARNTLEGQHMVDVAGPSSGRVTMVGFQKRYLGTFQKAKELLTSGLIGDPLVFRARHLAGMVFSPNSGWRYSPGSGGAVREFGPHILDMVINYFGEPVSVNSLTRRLFSSEVEDYAVAQLSYRSGLVGTVEVSWSMRDFRAAEFGMEVVGTSGSLSINQDRLDIYLDSSPERTISASRVSAAGLNPAVPFLFGSHEIAAQDFDFVRHVRLRTSPGSSFGDSLRVNRLIDTIVGQSGRR
jgi:predicted dehydrogenase